MGHPFLIHALGHLGHVAREVGDYAQATSFYQEQMGNVLTIACSLEDFAGLAGRQGQFERGAAEALYAIPDRTPPVAIAAEYECTVDAAHAALSEDAFAAAWKAGS